MGFLFVASSRNGSASAPQRMLEPEAWAEQSVPLLANPREVVQDLANRHLPAPGTAVLGVLGFGGRLEASASFTALASRSDGWERRNALLHHLRRIIPHDLRLRSPVRTGILMVCRRGTREWIPEDGAWMWGLRDACTLHGLRCGAFVTLSEDGWQVLGERRSGRRPHAGSWEERPAPDAWSGGPAGMRDVPRRHAAR